MTTTAPPPTSAPDATSPSWQRCDLTRLMTPRSIAIVGASPKRSRGTRVLENLLRAGYEGDLWVVHPTATEVLGVPAFPTLSALPHAPDLAVLSIPAGPVPVVIAEAREVGVGAVTVLAIGFGEGHAAGDDGGLRALAGDELVICGPNGFGVASIHDRAIGFNGRLPDELIPGPVAFISQSGGLAASFPSYMMRRRQMGFSYLVSPGNELAVGFEDYLEWMIDDPDTRVVGVYLETVRRPERLRQLGLRAQETGTSIVVMKTGRTPFAQEASAAHTAALATDDAVIDALLRQSGMVRVDHLNELAEAMSIAVSPRFRRAGWQLGVLSGSGGECSHVSDVATTEGFTMPPWAEATDKALSAVLPGFSVRRNPLDAGGAGLYEDKSVFPKLLEIVLADPSFETLAIMVGLDSRDWMVEQFAEGVSGSDRFVMAYNPMISGVVEAPMIATLRAAGIPYVESTEVAFSALAKLLRRSVPSDDGTRPRRWEHRSALGGTRYLDVGAAAKVLDEIGIAVPATHLASSEAEALAAAEAIGPPVALKIDHPSVTHKTELGGVRLGLAGPADIARHYGELRALLDSLDGAGGDGSVAVQAMAPGRIEMILGLRFDPVAGPAVLIGMGGILAELLEDVAVVTPPFTREAALAALRSLRGYKLFEGMRGAPPVPSTDVVEAMVALAEWSHDPAEGVSVVEVNPLVVAADGSVVAVDALVAVSNDVNARDEDGDGDGGQR